MLSTTPLPMTRHGTFHGDECGSELFFFFSISLFLTFSAVALSLLFFLSDRCYDTQYSLATDRAVFCFFFFAPFLTRCLATAFFPLKLPFKPQ